MRHLDTVTVKGSKEPIGINYLLLMKDLFTIDINSKRLHRASMRSNVKSMIKAQR